MEGDAIPWHKEEQEKWQQHNIRKSALPSTAELIFLYCYICRISNQSELVFDGDGKWQRFGEIPNTGEEHAEKKSAGRWCKNLPVIDAALLLRKGHIVRVWWILRERNQTQYMPACFPSNLGSFRTARSAHIPPS